MSGYIAIQRGLLEHHIFADEPFTEREAWIWLIEQAAWKKQRIRLDGRPAILGRGEVAHSLRFMAEAWQWHHLRVRRFLLRLASEGMIEIAKENCAKNETPSYRKTQRLTICNYDKYQSPRNSDETENETSAKQQRNKEEPLNHLTKEIDTEAGEIFDAIAELAKVPLDDPSLWGFNHQINAVLARGFSRETILAGAANAVRGRSRPPPWSYFAKCIESENDQRSQPAKPEISHGKSENLSQTAVRFAEHVASLEPRPSLTGGEENGPVVRLLSQGRRE